MDDDVFNIDPYSEAYQSFGTKEVKHNNQWSLERWREY